jgi:sugar/nucleoside kinase (ribokinase family)
MQHNYLVYGNLTLDDTVTLDNRVIRKKQGGNGLYSALGALVWSQNVGIVSRIGSDYPEEYLEELHQAGINLDGVLRIPENNIRFWILYEETGQRQIIYQGNSGRCTLFDPSSDQANIADVRFAHICSMILPSQKEIIGKLRGKVGLACDAVSFIDGIDLQQYRSLDYLEGVEIYLPSLEEVETIWEQTPDRKLMDNIANYGPQIIAVKMGKNGSWVFDYYSGRSIRVPIIPVSALDPTGAGDAYCAGFMVGYTETGDAVEAALMGTVSASFIVQGYGGMHALNVSHEEAIRRRNMLRERIVIQDFSSPVSRKRR